MKKFRKKLEEFSITNREFKIYWMGIEPYPECVCIRHKDLRPFTKKRKGGLRPYHNKADKCRYGNSHKTWKNYRKTQHRNIYI